LDERTADALVAKLIARGLIEERGSDIGPTRRWNARVQAAAERLNQDVERLGTLPEGNPLVLAVAQALRDESYEDADLDDADKRARYGFG
jgi:cytochrome P450